MQNPSQWLHSLYERGLQGQLRVTFLTYSYGYKVRSGLRICALQFIAEVNRDLFCTFLRVLSDKN